MIRNVCIHTSNEQPLLADLYAMPSAADAGLVCTNVRSMDGKRPVFIDQSASTFFFPYHVVRFLEIPQSEMARYDAEGPGRAPGTGARGAAAGGGMAADAGGEVDDGFEAGGPGDGHAGYAESGALLPVAVGAPGQPDDEDADLELEIDEGFLQRIRDL
ncbi:MAG TPA: hypothetical protein VFY23_13375 [Candidatus Limnocylindrales bacterium]|nr:hypothetical protein [Candidatus Limnocylindrales bacterium]